MADGALNHRSQFIGKSISKGNNTNIVDGARNRGVEPLDQFLDFRHIRGRSLHENRIAAVVVRDTHLMLDSLFTWIPLRVKIGNQG